MIFIFGNFFRLVVSSGIADQLIPGGRTSHSRFAIHLQCHEESTCNISLGSDLVELLEHTKLIIWDEAPITNKYCFEALDRSSKDIMWFNNSLGFDLMFGCKVVIFRGDFKQILFVIPKGTRQDIVLASLNSSYIWSLC